MAVPGLDPGIVPAIHEVLPIDAATGELTGREAPFLYAFLIAGNVELVSDAAPA